MIKVRKLAESDLEFAKSLTDAEEWGNSIEDWQRLLRISIPLLAYEGKELPTGDYWYVVNQNDDRDIRYVGHFTLYR